MRRLILKMHLSVDGFVGGPNGEVDWLFPSIGDAAQGWIVETLNGAGLHIMGSQTFLDMARHWPGAKEAYAAPMNTVGKVVFSRSGAGEARVAEALATARAMIGDSQPKVAAAARSWAETHVASGLLADEIGQLKVEQGRDILAHGGARFAQSLAATGLIDEYRLVIHPVALGTGLPLFSGLDRPAALNLVSSTAFPGGAVAQVYRQA